MRGPAGVRGWLVIAMFALAPACGSRTTGTEAPVAPAPASEPAAPEPPPSVPDEPADEPAGPPSLTDEQLDAMERGDIEAACVAGSTMACDRLGH